MEGTELATHDEWMDKKKDSLRLFFNFDFFTVFGRIENAPALHGRRGRIEKRVS